MALFYPKYDYTVPEVAKETISAESHTIPPSGDPIIRLRHIPKQDDPSTVSIAGFTEVTDTPGPGEFLVHYGERGFGQIEFHPSHAGSAVSVDYVACGTVVLAENYPDGRQGINAIQDAIDGALQWKLVAFDQDIDFNTFYDYDTGILNPVYQMWKIIVLASNHSGSAMNLNCRVNNDSSNNYEWRRYDGSQETGQSSWRLGSTAGGSLCHGVAILWGDIFDLWASANTHPGIAGMWGRNAGSPLQGGHLNVIYPNINRIQIFSDRNCTAKVAIYGMNFPSM